MKRPHKYICLTAVLLIFLIPILLPASNAFAQCTPLQSHVCQPETTIPRNYSINQQNTYWAVVGVIPTEPDDKDIWMYPSCNSGSPLALSTLTDGIDFIVGDFNHNALGTYYPHTQYGGDVFYNVYWNSGGTILPVSLGAEGTLGGSGAGCNMIRIYDVFLQAGWEYRITLNPDMGLLSNAALFYNPSASAYWAGRISRQLEISAGEAPGYYGAPASDWYGLVVFPAWNLATPTGYRVNVEKLGDCIPMESGICIENKLYTPATGPADDYTFPQEVGYWAAVAVLPDATDDKTLEMFTECDKNGNLLAVSNLAGVGDAEIIVGDFNHIEFNNYFPVVAGGDYSKDFSMEWNDGPEIFPVPGEIIGTMSGTNGECNLVRAWDVYLDAGVEYQFFFYKSGLKDPHIALFHNPGVCAYWVGRDEAQFEMGTNGTHNYTAPQSDWYGLVLFADQRDPQTSSYQIQIQPLDDCEPLAVRSCVERVGWPRDFEINQTYAHWSAIAVSTTGLDSKNLYMFTQCDAKGTLLASTYGDGTHLIVGDFNHNALGTYYPTVTGNDVNALYTVGADTDGEILATGTYVSDLVGRNPSSCNLVRMYDVYLESGVTYQIGFTRSGSADMRLALFRNPGNGTYWAGLSSAVLQAMESGNYSYTAPATDWYGIAAYANKRNEPGSYSIAVFEEGVTGIDPAVIDPEEFALYQNAPNPFNPSTVIRYDVPAGGGQVRLAVYDVNGRLVRALRSGIETAGEKSVTWDARDNNGARVASGVYFYRLVAPGFDETHKMVVTK